MIFTNMILCNQYITGVVGVLYSQLEIHTGCGYFGLFV